ncbi:MAG: hypothetical protein ACRD3W_32565, partial [Terriglobales bacterium]
CTDGPRERCEVTAYRDPWIYNSFDKSHFIESWMLYLPSSLGEGKLPDQVKKFLCSKSAEDTFNDALSDVGDTGTAADLAHKAVAGGAITAGAASKLGRFLTRFAASLDAAGKAGSGAAALGVLADIKSHDWTTALYDFTDALVYSESASAGAVATPETIGFSAATAALFIVLYHEAGGSKGLVQSRLCQ